MKKYILTLITMAFVITAGAQGKKFSPERFEADMENFITEKAGLTPQEADKVFPLLRKMHEKQRAIYGKVHKMAKNKPADEEGCSAMVNEYDKVNIELKQIEKCYHQKMMKEIPASKVYEIIKAEYRFHRSWMKGGKLKNKQR